MEGDRLANRAERLLGIVRYIYKRGSQGASVIEISKHFSTDRSQIYKDLESLERIGEPLYDENARWYIDRERYLNQITLNLREAVALYLAARLLSKQSDKYNPHIVSALDKLGDALVTTHEHVGNHIHQAAYTIKQRQQDTGYIKVYETLARAWADKHRVEIQYMSNNGEEWKTRTISPYYLEVSGIGFANYIIGHDSNSDQIRTFKLERIATAEARVFDTFEIPNDFDAQQRLGNAWGVIWPAEGEDPITVQLRFSPQVARRVKETIWHPSQKIKDLPDGSCRYEVQVGSTLEMKPWVRGWGCDVVVEQPERFRQEILTELHQAITNYQ